MDLKVDDEFAKICSDILAMNKNIEQWAEIESSDMFQTKHYNGGFDATEMEFCFSYYDNSKQEFWFQVSLDDIRSIYQKTKLSFSVRPAEK